MNFRTFWACTGCDKNYKSQRWGIKHLIKAHDGNFALDEFSPVYQQLLHDRSVERRAKQIEASLAWEKITTT